MSVMRAFNLLCGMLLLPAAVSADDPRPVPKGDRAERAAAREASCRSDPRVLLGQVSAQACIGAELFFRETFEGNGRTCGSCHPAQNNYTLDSDFIAQLPDSDPLFIAEHDEALRALENPELLRRFGLILVNPDGFEDPTHKFTVRSVSHMLGLSTSTTPPTLVEGSTRVTFDGTTLPPLERLGWSGDGAPGEGRLRDFADGAIRQHMTRSLERREGVDFQLPSDAERDAIAAFSRSIGRTSEVRMDHVKLFDARAERGRNEFLTGTARECSINCHFDAGANVALALDADGAPQGLVNLSRDIGTGVARLPEVNALAIPLDGGFGTRPLDLDFDGELDSFGNGAMNVQPLIEAADTAPMFHNHASWTLEDAIAFYASEDFAKSFVATAIGFDNREKGEPMPLTAADIADVGRFLRVLNAALNVQMAGYRARAAHDIAQHYGPAHLRVQQGLIALADVEVADGLEVLSSVDALAVPEQRALKRVRRWFERAADCDAHSAARQALLERACAQLTQVLAGLGSGLEMQIGPSTLLF